MTALTDPNITERLAKICGLFGSDHDGERAAAARMADRLVKDQGLSWFDVISPSSTTSTTTVEDQIDFALRHACEDVLNCWEEEVPPRHQGASVPHRETTPQTRCHRGEDPRLPRWRRRMSTMGKEADRLAALKRKHDREVAEKEIRLDDVVRFAVATLRDKKLSDADARSTACNTLVCSRSAA